MEKTFQQVIDEALARMERQGSPATGPLYDLPFKDRRWQADMLRQLEEHPKSDIPNRVHIGAGGFINFDIAAQTRPDYLLLLDVNEHKVPFCKELVTILKEQPTGKGFLREFMKRCTDDKPADIPKDVFGKGYFHTASGWIPLRHSKFSHETYFANHPPHWLTDPDAYAYIRRLACEGRIAAAAIDLTQDIKRARALGDTLRREQLVTDTCYWSNIPNIIQGTNWIPQSQRDDKLENLWRLTSKIGGDRGTHFFGEMGEASELMIHEGPVRDPQSTLMQLSIGRRKS